MPSVDENKSPAAFFVLAAKREPHCLFWPVSKKCWALESTSTATRRKLLPVHGALSGILSKNVRRDIQLCASGNPMIYFEVVRTRKRASESDWGVRTL